jgi:NADH-quinone oxidoreductase subunit G
MAFLVMAEEIYINKFDALIKIIENEKKNGKILVAQLAPAVRVTLGEEFGYNAGEDLTKKCFSVLKQLGFDYIFDTPLGADLAVYEEVHILKQLLDSNDKSFFPLYNSCCIGWKQYAKRMHSYLMPHVSSIASPNQIVGSIAKNYLGKKINKKVKDIIVVGIMPCTLKKFETLDTFDYFENNKKKNSKFVDYVLTTIELAQWIKNKNINFHEIKDIEVINTASKEGTIFGVTGGVTESFLTAFAKYLGKEKEILEFRENNELRTYKVKIGEYELNVAIVFGVGNINKILERIADGEFYHFVEMMFCKNGCVGGPGQPQCSESVLEERAKAMRNTADKIPKKTCFENSALLKIYSELNLKPNDEKVKNLFHIKEENKKEHKKILNWPIDY